MKLYYFKKLITGLSGRRGNIGTISSQSLLIGDRGVFFNIDLEN